jgi:hypothetical protein
MKRIKFGIIIAIIFATSNIHAQNHKLQGSLINEKSEPVEGAIVLLHSSDTLFGTLLSDTKGHFEISITKGDYKIVITEPSYETMEENLTITGDKKLAYTLRKMKEISLGEVEVTADRSNVITQTATGTIFRLSAAARSLLNPYEALKEIPKLVINDMERKITTVSGKPLVLLINGIRSETGINNVDPQDIEAVELIEFPSARYLKSGATTVLNIKVKRKKYRYNSFNANTRHSLPIMNGNSNIFFETGAEKYSIYLNGQHFYFHNDEMKYTSEQTSNAYRKIMEAERQYNTQNATASLGGDYVISDKNYLSYSITYSNAFSPPTESKASGTYTTSDGIKSNVTMQSNSKNNYYLNTYNVYYKHDFDAGKVFETTLRFNTNGQRSSGEQSEIYDNRPDYKYLHNYNNTRTSSSLDMNYTSTLLNQDLELGSSTNFRNDRITLLSQPAFPYRELTEYFYAGLSGSLGKKMYYSASLGTDIIFNKSEKVSNSYIKLNAAASLMYNINQANSVTLAFSQYNQPPAIGMLNPYNTSTDTLVRTEGNPYLKPEQGNTLSLSYSFNKNKIYISPEVSYTIISDNVTSSAFMRDNVFVRTYINEGQYSEYDAGVTLRFNDQKWGSIGGKTGYKHSYYTAVDRGSIYLNLNGNLRYKNLSANIFVYYQRYYTSPISVQKIYAPESELILGYKVSKNFTLNAGLRYFLGAMKYENIIESEGYHSVDLQRCIDRHNLFSIGFSYFWRNKVQAPQRQKKQLQSTEYGISL